MLLIDRWQSRNYDDKYDQVMSVLKCQKSGIYQFTCEPIEQIRINHNYCIFK